jgi:GAF domain-containing protein
MMGARTPASTAGTGGDGAPGAAGSIREAGTILERALDDLGAAGISFLTPAQARRSGCGRGATKLVDTPAEERFDRITREARERFGVSSASVALIAEHRQFLKSVIGPLGQNTPRDVAFCSETIRRAGPLIINDTLNDPCSGTTRWSPGSPASASMPAIRCSVLAAGPSGPVHHCQNPRDFNAQEQRELRALAEAAQREIND